MKKVEAYEAGEMFCKDGTNLKKLPSKFKYKKVDLSTYHCSKTGGLYGLQTIYATYSYNQSLSTFITFKECDTPRLLVDTLSLISKLQNEFENPPKSKKKTAKEANEKEKPKEEKTKYFTSPQKIFYFDKDLRPKAVNYIITWCKKYGFPFSPEISNKRASRSLFQGNEPDNHISFLVAELLYELYRLYSAFRLYQRITGNVEFGDSNTVIFNPVKDPKWPTMRFTTERLGGLTTDQCNKRFTEIYQERQYSCHITISDGGAHSEIIANSVLDAAYYQLAMLLNESERVLKKCPICHEYFEPTHARQKYCSNPKCNPQKAYKRRWLAEQRKKRTSE